FSSRRRHTRSKRDWSSDVCSSDLEKAYMISKSGEVLSVRVSTSLLYNDGNYVKTCICVFRDVTKIEKLQKQVYLADKLAALGRKIGRASCRERVWKGEEEVSVKEI